MNQPKRIIHLIATLAPGGCEYMLLLLLPALKKQGWSVTIATLGPPGPLAEKFQSEGIEVRSRLFRSFFDPLGIFRLRKLIREKDADLVVAHLFYADLLIRLVPSFFLGAKTVPLVHSTYRTPELWKLRLFEKLTAWSLKNCLLVSPAVKTTALGYGLRLAAGYVLPNPVDTTLFHPGSTEEKTSLRKRYGYRTDALIVVCVANFIGYKRQVDLIDAAAILREKLPKLELILIGHGAEEKRLKERVREHGLGERIHFPGNYLGDRQSVAEILRLSDLFALPSLFEGMCTAIMEAMSSGLPVIASDIEENRVLIPDNRYGRLTPIQDPASLSRALYDLSQSGTGIETLQIHAREHMLRNYSLPVITELWSATYDRICRIRQS